MSLLLIGFLIACWQFSAPPQVTPDMDFHVASIWCGGGISQGVCEEGSIPTSRLIPKALLDSCLWSGEAVSGMACISKRTDRALPAADLVETSRVNTYGTYSNGYYRFMNLFVGSDVAASTTLMRSLNSLLFLLVLLFGAQLIGDAPWRGLFLAAVITLPATAPLITSLSSQAWAVSGATLIGIVSLRWLEGTDNRKELVCLFAPLVIGLLLVLNSRTETSVMCVIVIAGVALMKSLLRTAALNRMIPLIVITVSGALSALLLLAPSRLLIDPLRGLLANEGIFAKYDASFVNLAFHNLLTFPTFVVASLFGDQTVQGDPPLLTFSWFLGPVIVSLLLIGSRLPVARVAWVACGIFGTIHVVLPVLSFVAFGQTVGNDIAPRYFTPMAVATLAILFQHFTFESPKTSAAVLIRRTLLTLLPAALGASFLARLRGNMTGMNLMVADPNLNQSVVWWPQLGPSPASVALVYLVASIAIARIALSPRDTASER